ncbi:MAG: 4Fe-4S single cluster domain-containing protein [Candidatus Geothermincolia bacterium]
MRIHRYLPSTRAEGPGERACVTVQGCPIMCPGCAVPWTWDVDGGYEVEVEEIAGQVLEGPEVEGITLIGGEPFAQAGACAELSALLRRKGLSVVVFTGYLLEEIEASGDEDRLALLGATDLLIDGPYIPEMSDYSRPWAGSSNQRFHFLTPRYRHLEGHLDAIPNRIEMWIGADGRLEISGMYDAAVIARMLESLDMEAVPRSSVQTPQR